VALGLLPGPGDEERFLSDAGLRHEQSAVRRAAALGIALQALLERPAAWFPAADRVVRALKGDLIRPALEDGAEAVFARGVLAAKANLPGEWAGVFDLAIQAGVRLESAIAAAQTLVFSTEPWLAAKATFHVTSGAGHEEPLIAAFLLIAGRSGEAEAVAACRRYLANNSLGPRGRPELDVRHYAVAGLLRGLASGAYANAEVRKEAVEALQAGVKRGLLQESEVRTRLERVLERQKGVLANPAAVLPPAEVAYVEQAFECPWGVTDRSLEDVGIRRLNDLVLAIFNLHERKNVPGVPDRTEIPQRTLKACLERYPYFLRRDLLVLRGLRPLPTMRGTERKEDEIRNQPK
jgi:hypothetical protein